MKCPKCSNEKDMIVRSNMIVSHALFQKEDGEYCVDRPENESSWKDKVLEIECPECDHIGTPEAFGIKLKNDASKYYVVTYDHSCGIMIQTIIEVKPGEVKEEVTIAFLRKYYDMDEEEFKEVVLDKPGEYSTFELPHEIGSKLVEKWDSFDHIAGFSYGEDSDSQASFGGYLAMIRLLQLITS